MHEEAQAPETTSAEVEHGYHNYTGNAIPWFVRVIWIGFWVYAVYYTVQYLFPALRIELFESLTSP
ncbi:MAG: hypothetical protein KDA41_00970 [Planctomycetales bacterium]|nr:hypothetical protein [Planctomycetales bacterium]